VTVTSEIDNSEDEVSVDKAAHSATLPKGWPDMHVRLLLTDNPKRGASKEAYALYRDGMSVA